MENRSNRPTDRPTIRRIQQVLESRTRDLKGSNNTPWAKFTWLKDAKDKIL